MRAAVWAEALKSRRALVAWLVLAALGLGPAVISASLVVAARSGNPVAQAQLEPFVGGEPWADLATLVGIIAAAGGLLGFGVYLGWSFGREFSDRTVAALFAIPTPLSRIAAAKLLVYAAGVVLVAALGVGALLAAGALLGYPSPAAAAWLLVGKVPVVVVLTGAVALPCAWAATLGRGVLGAVGLAAGLLVLSQIALVTVGAWFPVAAPGAWAGLAGSAAQAPSLVQLLLALGTGLAFAALTLRQWQQLRLR